MRNRLTRLSSRGETGLQPGVGRPFVGTSGRIGSLERPPNLRRAGHLNHCSHGVRQMNQIRGVATVTRGMVRVKSL
jgi:hypothetical protein